MVSVRTGIGKSLMYQGVFLINLGVVTLTITLTILLIEDQEKKLRQRDVSALELTTTAVKANPNI